MNNLQTHVSNRFAGQPGRQVVEVWANRPMNPTGFEVQQGKRYTIEVLDKEASPWADCFGPKLPAAYKADSAGKTSQDLPAGIRWYMRWFEPFRRSKNDNWLSLLGLVQGKNDQVQFYIGKGLKHWVAPISGKLFLYANDVPWLNYLFYKGNRGVIPVSIQEEEPSTSI